MLVRLPRSMARGRSKNAQFNERIPKEHVGKTDGLRLEIPCGDEVIALKDLYARWEAEAERSAPTRDTYSRAFRMLEEHLGHGDTARITKADIVAFKDARIAAGRHWKTVNDGDPGRSARSAQRRLRVEQRRPLFRRGRGAAHPVHTHMR